MCTVPYSGNVWRIASDSPNHLKLARVTHLVLNSTSFDLRNFYCCSIVLLIFKCSSRRHSRPSLVLRSQTSLLEQCAIKRSGYARLSRAHANTDRPANQLPKFRPQVSLNMLYKAYRILLLTQFAIINAVLHNHESALRFLILPWCIKRFYAPLRAPRNH